jgi:hypothetical protein
VVLNGQVQKEISVFYDVQAYASSAKRTVRKVTNNVVQFV